MREDYKGFLLVRGTYKVKCLNCQWQGQATLGSEPVMTEEQDGADYCPVCGAMALVGENYTGGGER